MKVYASLPPSRKVELKIPILLWRHQLNLSSLLKKIQSAKNVCRRKTEEVDETKQQRPSDR